MLAPWAWPKANPWLGGSLTAWAPPLDRTICATAGLVYTLGAKVGMQVQFYAESKVILLWGSNSIASNLHFSRYAQQAKRNTDSLSGTGLRFHCQSGRPRGYSFELRHAKSRWQRQRDATGGLPALTGAWRQRAGGLLLSSSGTFPVRSAALEMPELRSGYTPRTIGDDLLRPASPGFSPVIQALMVYNSNPAVVAPQSGKLVDGFTRDDLFTVVLEHWDIHRAYGHTDTLLNRTAIAPMGECKPNTQIFRELAAAMGFTETCFSDSDERLARTAFGDQVSFDTLLAKGYAELPIPDEPFTAGCFPTPSGKCEFFSQRLEDEG